MNFSRSNFKKMISAVCATVIVAGSFPMAALMADTKEEAFSDSLVRLSNANSNELTIPDIQQDVLDIPDIKDNATSIAKIKQNVFTDAKVEISKLTGNITREDQEDTFEFTAKRDGVHRFEFSGIGEDPDTRKMYIEVTKPDGTDSADSGANGAGVTLKLKAGEKVGIKASQYVGKGSYTINIGQPIPVTDVSKYTKVKGGIAFTDQQNIYKFTAPRNGQYRFELADIKFTGDGTEDMWIEVKDSHGKSLSDNRGGFETGVTVELKKGEIYTVEVDYALWSDSYGSYTLILGFPKETKDVSKFTKISDNIEYTDQINTYSYTAPTTGQYRLELDNMGKNDPILYIRLCDADGKEIESTVCENGEGQSVDLTKGKKYLIKVEYDGKLTPYRLSIGVAKASRNVSEYNRINDSVQFTEQKNVYTYVPSVDAEYRIELRGIKTVKDQYVKLNIINPKGESLAYVNVDDDEDGYTLKLVKNTTYRIEVEQDTGFLDYTVCIWSPKAVQDITGKSYVKDSIEYDDQVNKYTFTASAGGKFKFQLEDFPSAEPQNYIDVRVRDANGESLGSDVFSQRGENLEVELTKGAKYTLEVVQDKGFSGYTIVITDAKNNITPTPVPENPAQPTKKPVPNNDSTKQIKAFVERIYTYVLDREPEEDGSKYWTAELYNFDRSGAEVAQGFIFSEEFINRNTTDEQFVTILYKTFFGRDPEADGMNYWLTQLSTGAMSRVDVANGFIFSQEWADTCAKYGIRSGGSTAPTVNIEPTKLTRKFVERMYTTAMQREYDEAGRDYWASELSNFRVSGEAVGASFFLSDEMNGFNLEDGEFINRLYKTFMDREADGAGKEYWISFMAGGHSRAEVVYGFTRSPEFIQKCIDARILPF